MRPDARAGNAWMIGQDDDRALGILEIGKCGGCLILSIESVGKECQLAREASGDQSALLRATSCQSSSIAILIIVISYMRASGLTLPDAGRTLRRVLGESD